MDEECVGFLYAIATLIFTVVFGSAFAVPGGYNQETGIPILIGNNWFTCSVIFEALAMLSSAFSILCFLRIMMTGSMETHFSTSMTTTDLARSFTRWFVWGLNALSFSVLAAVSVFMSAYFLVLVGERAVFVVILIIVVYVVIVSVVSIQIYAQGFPTLYFRSANGNLLQYEGDRTKEDIINFIDTNRDKPAQSSSTETESVDGDYSKDEL